MIDSLLKNAIEGAWSGATASPDNNWSADNPAAGHCDVTALVVRERVGGALRMAHIFRNGEFSEHHYWNLLPDGLELDLTRSQFSGDEEFGDPTTMTDEFFEAAGPLDPALLDRLDRFRSAVDRRLAVR